MKIKVRLTRQENADYYHVNKNDVVEISFKEYLYGVVASEIGSSFIEACKAQAVASRTFAYPYALSQKIITDSSSSHQAFRASLINQTTHKRAYEAVDETESEILFYNNSIISPCAFSSCNHGHTTSSEERWGGYRAYLIEQNDPWDAAASYSKSRGHGVGMSQVGAQYAAKQGISYRDILSFYYPGTTVTKEGSLMAQVKASDLVKIFDKMASEKWKYVAGAHKTGEVDCSGAFYYAYKQLGGYMYHGSNTMWRSYTAAKGKITDFEMLLPGMAVFKIRDWTSSQSENGWYDTDPGDVYHVGMYIGNGKVVEAKSTKYGVVYSDISTWKYAAKLKETAYDMLDGSAASEKESPTETFSARMGVVKISSGWLNLRKEMNVNSERMGKLYAGDVVTVVGSQNDWYLLQYNGKTVYCKNKYIELVEETKPQYVVSITVFGDDELQRMKDNIQSMGYKPVITEGGIAA